MGARVIDGRGLAAELKEKLAAEVAGLATVLVGSPAEATQRSLETADRGDIVRTCTISVESVSGERII